MSFYSLSSYSQYRVNQSAIGGTPTPPPFTNTKSILLDGIDDEVSMDFTNTSTTGSISVWIKPTDFSTGSQSICIYTSGGYRDYIMLHSQNTGGIRAVSADNGATKWDIRTNTGHLTNGVWTHICFVFNGTSGTFYINGNSVAATYFNTTNTSWWWDDLIPTQQKLGVFRVNGYTTSLRYNGNIEEQSAFTSALTSTEVSAIYNNGLPTDLSSQSNILAWYRCGDGDTAPILTDNIGSNNGTMTNFSTFSTDVPPNPFANTKSILLDGVDDYVDCGNPTSLQITNTITLSAWVKMSSTSGQSQDCIISKDNGSTQRSYTLWGKTSFSSSPIAYIWNGGTNYSVQATTNIEDDNWHHVMLVYVPSTSLNIYIDGVLEGSNTTSIPSSINNAIQNFHIGQFGNGTFKLNGNIDEVALWNSDQSANASTIYNSGVPNDISSLSPLSWWRCGDGDTSPTLTDNGSGGNDGTMTNFSTFSTDVPT